MPEEVFTQLSWFRSERVAQARVMVVGCGALGNEVLKNLVLFGVQHLVVDDFDRVESSNLSRSVLFTREDAQTHTRKIDAVKASIERINPSAEVVTLFGDIAYEVGLGWFRGVDVVIGCVDNRWARYCINRLCMRAGIPWVDGGIDGLEGTVRVFIPGENCYACNLGPEGLKDLKRRCAGTVRRDMESGKVPTTSIAASIIAAVQVQEALKLIHREQLESGELTSLCGRMFCYEGQHLTTRTVAFKAYDDDCPVHERWEPVLDSALTIKHTVGQCLDELQRLTGEAHPEVVLNDCFVDYVESRRTGEQVSVMCPGREVERRIEQDSPLKGSLLGELYQHEYRKLDETFPYSEMSLEQVGIPARDVLWVHTSDKDYYIALNGE